MLTRREALALLAASPLAAIAPEEIQLGITTDEIDEDVRTAAEFLRRFGLNRAEVRSIWGKYNTGQPLERVREARTILEEHGVRVSIADTAFFRGPLPPDNAEGARMLDEQWVLLGSAIERARIFGTDKLRTFAFTYREGETPTASSYPRIYELLGEAARRAKPLRLAIENLFHSYVVTSDQAADMLRHVKAENLGLTWDPNNAAQAGDHPFPEGFGKLDPARIFHVHLRDYRHRPDGKVEWCAVGEGEFDNAGQIRALRKAGYREAFTLETHWRDPKGKAYSTEVSLKGLLEVLRRV